MLASSTWLRCISLSAAFFPSVGHAAEERAQIVETDGSELGFKLCHSLSCVTLATLLTSLNFGFLILQLLWGLNEITHIKSVAYVDVQRVLIPLLFPNIEAEGQLNFTGRFNTHGFFPEHSGRVWVWQILWFATWGCIPPPGSGQGQKSSWTPGTSEQCGQATGSFGLAVWERA